MPVAVGALIGGGTAVRALADFVIGAVVSAEVVTDVQARHPRGEVFAWLVHAEQFGYGIAEGIGAIVRAQQRDLRHRVV